MGQCCLIVLLFNSCSKNLPSEKRVIDDLNDFARKFDRHGINLKKSTELSNVKIVGTKEKGDITVIQVTFSRTGGPTAHQTNGNCSIELLYDKFGDDWRLKDISDWNNCN